MPRPPTRAFAKPAEPGKPAVKGSKIAEPPQTCTVTPSAANQRAPSQLHRLTQAGRSPGGLQHLPEAGRPRRLCQVRSRSLGRDVCRYEICLQADRPDCSYLHGAGCLAWADGGERLGEGADVVAAVVGVQGYPDAAAPRTGVDVVLARQRGLHLVGRGGGVPE